MSEYLKVLAAIKGCPKSFQSNYVRNNAALVAEAASRGHISFDCGRSQWWSMGGHSLWCALPETNGRLRMIMPKSDTVTMTRDAWNDVSAYIDKLEKDLEFLNALKACGVDNWDGYSDAVEMVYGEDDE